MRIGYLSLTVGLGGCLVLDPLLPFHNNIPCSEVNDETCNTDEYWDRVCLTCEDPYDWDRAYEWREKTIKDGATIRGIDPNLVSDVPFESNDGEAVLDAYFISAHGDVPELSQTTILYNNGRFASIEHYLPRIQLLHELGANLYVWDYRGYGKSLPETAPESIDWMDDARKAFEQAKLKAPDPNKIIVYGMSIGGFPAGEIADTKPVCAQIFEASVVSISEKVEENTSVMLPGSFLTSGVLETDIKLADTKNPTLILHGSNDYAISPASALSFYDKLPNNIFKKLVLIEGAGHGLGDGGVPEAGFLDYQSELMTFLGEGAPNCLAE